MTFGTVDANWVYVSEMAISEMHGGGLTVRRVLGETLPRFRSFVHTSRFAKEFPPADNLRSRTIDFPMWAEHPRIQQLFGQRIISRLWMNRWARRRHGARVAGELRQNHVFDPYRVRILACPQSDLSLYALEYLRRDRGIRYATWMMDDHLLRFHEGSWGYARDHASVMQAHLGHAEVVLTISSALAAFYKARFGVEATVLFNPCESVGEPAWLSGARGPIRLGYFGSVSAWQADALECLVGLAKEGLVVLEIYSHTTELPSFLQRDGIHQRPPIGQSAVLAKMRQFDAVLLPISFLPRMRPMSEFNIATKMSECIASGTVTLVIGPDYSAMVNYLAPHDAAVIVTKPDRSSLESALDQVRSAGRRRTILRNAQALARGELSMAVIQGTWTKCMRQLDQVAS